ncbi:MAG TPA: DUF4325 domain-containing protein [Spirochaetota bacterium]|nr:DUF4325 domain-containing protein [Spirochaetota bacterium]HPJ35884.1 DUF4325 domain-containing protein [Spirochaetota bacterium]
MIVNVAKLAREAKVKLPDLITRPVGRLMYSKMKEKLTIAGRGETVIFDFENIKVIDSSFIDEFLVKVIKDAEESDFYIKLRNISAISEINIDSVFNSYSNYRDGRLAVIREELGKNNRYYIGPLTENESDIIDYLRINNHADSDEMARFCGQETMALTETLENLLRLRVIRRDNGEYLSV